MEQKNIITEDKIFELYGDYILNHGERPKNIYRFAKWLMKKNINILKSQNRRLKI